MLCFRDKTFCSAKCATKECHRQFTETEAAAVQVAICALEAFQRGKT